MNPPENSFHIRKLEHIKRDYDHTLSIVLKLSDHGNSVRQWNITIIVAYLVFAKVYVEAGKDIPILPLLGAIYVFWVMEAFVKAQSYLYSKHTLEIVDRLFSEKDDSLFDDSIGKYKFQRMVKRSCTGKWGRVHRLSCGLVNCQTFVFYMLPLAILIGWHWPSLKGFTFTIPLPVVLPLPAIGFVLVWFYYRWKYAQNE